MYECRVCKNGILSIVDRITTPHSNRMYDLYECDACMSRQFDVSTLDDDVCEFYEARAVGSPHLATKFKESSYWRKEVSDICMILNHKPRSVLDIGCRTGDFLMHWDNDVCRVGVELAESSLRVARDRGLTVFGDFFENIEFNQKFEVVTLYALAEHLKNPLEIFEKITQIVDSRGLIAIMVPSYETLKPRLLKILNKKWHMYCPPEHLNFFTRKFLDNYFVKNGFELVDRKFTSGGMFNPFSKNGLLRKAWFEGFWNIESYTPIHDFPIFDHMYSYYKKND